MRNSGKPSKIAPQPSQNLANGNGKIHFTKGAIEALEVARDRPVAYRAMYRDDKVPGLCVSVAPSGLKVFILYRWIKGKPEKLKLGRFPEMTVEQARGKAQEMNGAVARGENPADERREVRDEMTLDELFQTWLLLYAKANKRTWEDDQWMFDKYLHSWRLRKISSITKPEVVRLHKHLGETKGQTIANRVVELLSAMFNRAMRDWGWTGTVNPASGVRAFKEVKRSRFLDGDELPAFFKALAVEPNREMRDFFLLSLLTGARRANVQSMRWPDINWQRSTWTVSAEQSKNGEELSVVLVPMAVQLLEARAKVAAEKVDDDEEEENVKQQWVFPGVGKSGHLVEPKSAWKRITERAGIGNCRMHDLRRTFGSWQAATGASLQVIGKSLGHQSLEATTIYSRLQLNSVRESAERATSAMMLAGKVAGLLTGGE